MDEAVIKSFGEILPELTNDINELSRKAVEIRNEQNRLKRQYRIVLLGSVINIALCMALVHYGFFISFMVIYFIPYFYVERIKSYPEKFGYEYKKTLLPKMVKLMLPDIRYHQSTRIDINDLNFSHLVNINAKYRHGQDHFSGVYHDCKFEFMELEYGFRRKDIFGEHKIVQGKGLFLWVQFHKKLNKRTFVVTDKLRNDQWFARLIKGKSKNKAKLEILEDPIFEKYFDVYSDDPVEARYVLSTSFVRRLTKYHTKKNIPMKMSFKDNRMYIFADYPYNLFELDHKDPDKFRGQLKWVYEDIKDILTLIPDLNLNRKIWTKQ